MIEKPETLKEQLQSLLTTLPGGDEREQVNRLLQDARSFEFSDNLTKLLSDIEIECPWNIEHHLDHLQTMTQEGPIWIEWNEEVRSTAGGQVMEGKRLPERVGAFVFPQSDNIIAGMVAWRLKGERQADQAPAFFSVDLAQLAEHAQKARKLYSKDATEVNARLMSFIYTHVPQSFREEVEILHGIKTDDETSTDMYIEQARRDVSAEVLYIMGALLALQTPQSQFNEGYVWSEDLELSRMDRLLGRKGFYHKDKKGAAELNLKNIT